VSDEKQLQRYKVKGSWVSDCEIAFSEEGMYLASAVDALLQDSTRVHTSILRGTIALTKEQAIHIAGLPADIEAQVQALHGKITDLRELCAAAYQFVGAHSIEDDGLVLWLDALSAATAGEPFTTENLLPYTLPQDRPRTNHGTQNCKCYGCVLDRVQALHAELDATKQALAEQIAITLSERARHEAHIKRLEVERGMLWDELTKVVGVERVHALSEAVLAARAQGEKP
jgi:hypothetical protein